MKLVPTEKSDDEACDNLANASDEEIIPHIAELLECLQDLNWPIAGPVSDRLSTLGMELVEPILTILKSDDEMWKYWIVSHLLYLVRSDVFRALSFKLNSMKLHPTDNEVDEEVHSATCELLMARQQCKSCP